MKDTHAAQIISVLAEISSALRDFKCAVDELGIEVRYVGKAILDRQLADAQAAAQRDGEDQLRRVKELQAAGYEKTEDNLRRLAEMLAEAEKRGVNVDDAKET